VCASSDQTGAAGCLKTISLSESIGVDRVGGVVVGRTDLLSDKYEISFMGSFHTFSAKNM
jgi:hypothetical protein